MMPATDALRPYDRAAAVTYTHRWAFARNPAYYNYDALGGDCTNFASQCLFAGTGVMNFTPTFGWYYRNANEKAPAWSGVEHFFSFMTRPHSTPGPVMQLTGITGIEPGDFIQLRFNADRFGHTPVVVEVGTPPTPDNIMVAAHSYDTDYRPLSTYAYTQVRFLHVLGFRSW